MSEDDFYLDERLPETAPEITPEWETPDDGGGSGGGGGGGGGSGWGPGGGGTWHYPGEDEPEEPAVEPPETVPEEEPENAPVLKRSPEGRLLRCASGHLLLGDLTCNPEPHFLLRIRGEGCAEHARCALWRLSDGRRTFEAEAPAPDEEDAAEEEVLVCCRHIFLQAGRFSLQLRWQGGHYDHRTVREMRVTLFGIDLGWKVYPLDWITAADVLITPEGQVFVNSLEGQL